MVAKVSDRIGYLRSVLAILDEETGIYSWLLNHNYYNVKMTDLTKELKLAHGICYWAETNFLLPGGGGDNKVLESLMDELQDSLYEREVEIKKNLFENYSSLYNYNSLFTTFIDAAKSLMSLFLNNVDKYKQLYSSSHHSRSQYYFSGVDVQVQEESLNFMITIVSEDSPMEMGIVRYKLEFVKEFIRFADYRGVPKYQLRDLLAHGLFMAITAVYYSYMHLKPDVIEDKATSKVIDNQFSEILTMHPPQEVREIYVGALKATISSTRSSVQTRTRTTDDNHDIVVSFIDSFVENHLQLLKSNSSFTVSAVKILAEEVRFFKNFLLYKRSDSNQGGDDHLVARMIDLFMEAGIVIYSHSWDDDLKEELIIYTDAASELEFSDWMKHVEVFKRDVGMKYPETSRYKFPRTNELGFIDGLLEDLKQFMIRDDNRGLIMDHRHHQVLEHLVFLRDFLRKIVRLRHEDVDLNALWIQVVEVAYRIEFVINSMVVGDSSPDCTPASFYAIKEEIKKIKEKVEEKYMQKKGFLEEIDVFEREKVSNDLPSRSVSRSSSNPKMDEVMVGFEDEIKKMIDRIESKSSKLEIVSIVGMGGQGKTTLAKKVYNEVGCQFQVCAWCCISQGYEKHKWLIDILRGTLNEEIPSGVDSGGYDTRNEGDLEKDIYQSLKGKRYLIVLDDIWDIKAWHGLKSCFPDDNEGSRILLTTRMHDVALQAAGLSSETDCNTHFLRPLNDQESWELLRSMLFQNEDCRSKDDKLPSVGMRIAESCKGLPFAIVTVAGILGTMEQDEWEEFAKGFSPLSLLSHTDVLELSYIHLPDYLKPCLLYFGSFLQDQQIPVSRIVWLWIAEGLVQKEKTDEKQEEESLEILAMEYLKDLIKRSLVMVKNEKSRGGGIKSCSVHDLVHQFCTTKAKEENFQQQLNLPDEIRVPLPEPHRLCIYSPGVYFSQVRLSFRHLSSLILFPIGQKSPDSYDISSNIKHFKLLKVLDLRRFISNCFPPEIEMLVQLRYLALVGPITSVPSRTTAKLSKLETFILKGTRGEITLPYNLLNTTELRHLQVNNRVAFCRPEEEEEYLCQESCNLESFCTLRLSDFYYSGQEISHNIIKKIKNIKKLKCSFFGSWHSKEGYQIPAELSNLTQLESLKLHSIGKVRYQLELNNFPSNLRKVTLSNFYLPWERLSVFAELQNLEILKLLSKACEGETWDMGEEVFSNLQFLKLENLDIVHWNAYSENFPRLRQLVLNRCKKLEGIPMGMEEIDTIKVIEVNWCKESVATSAEALKEDIEGLKVFIQIRK